MSEFTVCFIKENLKIIVKVQNTQNNSMTEVNVTPEMHNKNLQRDTPGYKQRTY